MDGAALDRIAKQLVELSRVAAITVAECDSAIHSTYRHVARKQTFKGGGDTAFAPVFEEAARRSEFAGVVYFTDGKGPMPELPRTLATLWAITHNDPFLPDFGTILRVLP
jgi:predicted metal-dependent peptidase